VDRVFVGAVRGGSDPHLCQPALRPLRQRGISAGRFQFRHALGDVDSGRVGNLLIPGMSALGMPARGNARDPDFPTVAGGLEDGASPTGAAVFWWELNFARHNLYQKRLWNPVSCILQSVKVGIIVKSQYCPIGTFSDTPELEGGIFGVLATTDIGPAAMPVHAVRSARRSFLSKGC
jgi:hypothetical protein